MVKQRKLALSHAVRTRVGGLTVELRAVPEPAVAQSAADVFATIGPWAGETTDQILTILADARRQGGHRSVPEL